MAGWWSEGLSLVRDRLLLTPFFVRRGGGFEPPMDGNAHTGFRDRDLWMWKVRICRQVVTEECPLANSVATVDSGHEHVVGCHAVAAAG